MTLLMNDEMQRKYDSISHIGAERAVLNIAIINPETLFDIATELEPDDFSNTGNQIIYQIMLSILDGKYANIGKVNSTVIHAIAQNSGVSEDIGGMQYLEMIQRSDAGEENLRYYVDKVKQASTRREAFRKALSVINEAIENDEEAVDSFVARQEEKFLDIVMKASGSTDIIRIGDRIDFVLDQRETSPREIMGMPTGFPEYDRQTGGLVPGRLKCVAATAKTGKSAHALNVAINVAVREGIPVLYVDTEMQTDEQIDRMVSILATELSGILVPESAVIKGLYARNPEMKAAVDMARAIIKEAPLYHVYMPSFTPEKLNNIARKFQRQYGVSWNGFENQFLLLFDYIKLPEGGDVSKEYAVLGELTNMLKNKVAGMLNIPVLAYAQLNPRTGHGISGDINSSYMSGSNRIVMYVNELSFLTKKPEEEIQSDGIENGNLIWKLGETRNGGEYKGWLHYDIRRGVTAMKEIRNVALSA